MQLSTMATHAIVLALGLGACSKGSSGSGPGGAAVTIDIAAINALVPARLRDKLVFEKRDVTTELGGDKRTYTLAVPRGWTQDGTMYTRLVSDDLNSSIRVSSSCGGRSCGQAQDWAAVSDREWFGETATRFKVLKDEKAKGRRTMIATDDMMYMTQVAVAWWREGGRHYQICSAKLGESIKDAAPAFERACSEVNVDRDE